MFLFTGVTERRTVVFGARRSTGDPREKKESRKWAKEFLKERGSSDVSVLFK